MDLSTRHDNIVTVLQINLAVVLNERHQVYISRSINFKHDYAIMKKKL